MAFQWDKKDIWEIAHFGKWISVSSTATFLSEQSDRLILGILLPGSMLGLYAIAVSLIEAVRALLERLNALTLPVMAELLRRDPQALKEKYYRFRLPFEIFAALSAGILCMAGPLVANILFDQRYADVGDMLQILALGLVSYPALFVINIFTVVGDTREAAMASILQAISLIVSLFLGYLVDGERGVVWGVAIHKFIPATIMLILARRRHWVDLSKELRVIPMFLVGLGIGVGIVQVLRFIHFEKIAHFVG